MSDNIAALLKLGRCRLSDRGENPRLDAELLLANVLNSDRSKLYAHSDSQVAENTRAEFMALIERRAAGEPLAYLTGEKEFWSLSLQVTPATLIPRPETELLVALALERAAPDARIADLGTGSGAIAIALAKELPRATLVATDASGQALAIASANAALHCAGNIEFRLAAIDDWFGEIADEVFDLIVSNPPYVCVDDPALERDDIRYEPVMALAAGDNGLYALRQIIAGASARLAPGGWLLVEHGHSHGEAVAGLFADAGFTNIETRRDLAGHERVTLGRLSS